MSPWKATDSELSVGECCELDSLALILKWPAVDSVGIKCNTKILLVSHIINSNKKIKQMHNKYTKYFQVQV